MKEVSLGTQSRQGTMHAVASASLGLSMGMEAVEGAVSDQKNDKGDASSSTGREPEKLHCS